VFTADFPDDCVEDNGEIVRFGGRNVAEAVRELLRGLGCDVDQPRYAGERGWEFGARRSGRRFWCQVTSFHPQFLLYFEDDPPVQAPEGHHGLAEAFDATLRRDGRFHDLLWYSEGFVPGVDPGGVGNESPFAPTGARAARRRMTRVQQVLLVAAWLAICALYYAFKEWLPGW